MEVKYESESLERLEKDPTYSAGYDGAIVKSFRMRIQLIRAAIDERAFYSLKSLHFEKLRGDRLGQHSMRLNSQWRLIIKFEKTDSGKLVVVVSISDYH